MKDKFDFLSQALAIIAAVMLFATVRALVRVW